MTTSATGSYLVATPIIDGGLGLDVIWQGFVAGVTGLDGSMVRPAWQPVSPKMPSADTDWAAVGVLDETPDAGPALLHRETTDSLGTTHSVRHSQLRIIAAFYGPRAHGHAIALRDGAGILQNQDVIKRHKMGIVEVGQIINATEMAAQGWLRRVDVHIIARRMVTQQYAIHHITGAHTHPIKG